MIYGDALKLIGGLSNTEKMPWWSWSISAKDCITGSKLQEVENSICSECYALKGRYTFGSVLAAHERRKLAIGHPDFVEAFVTVLTNLHAKTRKRKENGEIENRFRWMDSGDIQSLEMLEDINEIARRTPQIRHWLPTREISIVREFLAKHGTFQPNLIVRISVPEVGVTLQQRPFGLSFATVGCGASDSVHSCQAISQQGNRCLNCEMCWTHSNINYPLH